MAKRNVKRLIIQIPCYNEEEHLPRTLNALPRLVEGIGEIQVLVVNDGSTDRTGEVARECGADHVLDMGTNRGLAEAFMAGLEEATRLGADYLVNLDADNQYDAADIPTLLRPILNGEADLVVGERPIHSIEHFSWIKKRLQVLGSYVVSRIAGVKVNDVTSGYRALNRNAMLSLFVFNKYTYTHESLLVAKEVGLRVVGVPIHINEGPTRPSRLMKSTLHYIFRSTHVIVRAYVVYNPYPVYTWIASIFGVSGLALLLRFLYFYAIGQGAGWIQSVIISVFLMLMAFLMLLMGIFSDGLSINRRLSMKILRDLREHFYTKSEENDVRKRSTRRTSK